MFRSDLILFRHNAGQKQRVETTGQMVVLETIGMGCIRIAEPYLP